MRKPSLFLLTLSLFVTVASAPAQQQDHYYVFNGKTLRTTDTRATFPAVNYATTESSAYLVFLNSAEAQDASAYFLYHKRLGR